MAISTADKIAEQFTAYYRPIVDLNTGAIAGFEALARVVKKDGSVTSLDAVIEKIERRPDTLKALIRTILVSPPARNGSALRASFAFLCERQHPARYFGQRSNSADDGGAGAYALFASYCVRSDGTASPDACWAFGTGRRKAIRQEERGN